MPDAGAAVLLTRPRASSERFAAQLKRRTGAEIIISPVIEIEPVGDPVDTSRWGSVIFTSAHAVAQTRNPPGQLACCVGEATAAAARAAGYAAETGGDTAAALADHIRTAHPSQPMLYVRGQEVSCDLAAGLGASGISVESVIAYRQRDQPLTEPARARARKAERLVAPVFSPRSAARLSAELPPHPDLRVVAISERAAKAWSGPDARIVVAGAPEAGAMANAVLAALRTDSSC